MSINCIHCDEDITLPLFNLDDINQSTPFCCQGCLTVFNVIHQKGLTDYYEIKNNSKIYKRRAPVELKQEKFKYLDSIEFVNEFSYKSNEGLSTMEFYLEGIHCLACLWLIEKLPEFLSDVKCSRLDMGKSVATITIFHRGKFSNVARELNNLGYRPHPLKRNAEIESFKKREERSSLLKIGIAGAGAGNVMLYAVSIYGGATGIFLKIFSVLTVTLAIPVLTYSAYPFYKNAYNAIKTKTLSIDVPIAGALLMGLFLGLFNLFTGNPENYFDSLTMLVFLLSLSRYFLQKVQEQGLKASDLNFFYQTDSILKKEGNDFVETHSKYLKVNDIIKVKPLDFIPVDGIVLEGTSSINNSLLTGESLPINIFAHELVYSGTQNLSDDLIIQVNKTDSDTRLGLILKQVEDGWIQKSKIVDITNRISKYFIIVVFFLAAILGIWLFTHGQTREAIERSFTLLIVTCPCALALATPLTLTNTLSKAAKLGIIIKNDLIIEKLTQVKNVFLDKTGTVTFGNLQVVDWNLIKIPKIKIQNIIHALEVSSNHPAARALITFAKTLGTIDILKTIEQKELIGIGVFGKIDGNEYRITKNKIFENDILIAEFNLRDQVRSDSYKSIQILKRLKIIPKLISGDQKIIVEKIGNTIGILQEDTYYEVSPENKLKIIEQKEFVSNSMMIGDGANDAMALSKAFVGVAVHGSMDISLRAADVYLTTPGIAPIVDLIIISKETLKVIYRNLVISLMYNGISVWAAYTGHISPLTAAIIMPISSLSVLVSTLLGTKLLNERLKV